MKSSPAVTSLGRLPSTESYLRRCASVLGLVRSLTATNSRPLSSSAVRSTFRPIRPNPLIATLIAISPHGYEFKIQDAKGPASQRIALTLAQNQKILASGVGRGK